jgi:thioredoxin reductase (NADPH)
VYYAATAVEAQLCRSAQVVIIGGGNSVGQAAVFLSEHSTKVLLIIREEDLKNSMSHYLIRHIEQTANIEVRSGTQIAALHGDESSNALELTHIQTDHSEILACQAVFVFIGAMPKTQWLPETIQVDQDGFVKTGLRVASLDVWPLRRSRSCGRPAAQRLSPPAMCGLVPPSASPLP